MSNWNKLLPWLLIGGLIITIIGLITGSFFFLLLVIPLGFLFKDRSDKSE